MNRPRPPAPAAAAAAGKEKREKKLGRGLDEFSHLFFSSDADDDGAPAGAARARSAPSSASAPESAPRPWPQMPDDAATDAGTSFGRPQTLFVTSFRAGCGKSFIASAVSRECARSGGVTNAWQLDRGVIVPRRGDEFGPPVPHPSDRRSFEAFALDWRRTTTLILDGPVSLVADGDPFALSAGRFLVIALPGPEGAAEGYAAVKQIIRARPEAAIRVLVNRADSQGEARDAFHKISDVSMRYLGRPVRSYGGLPELAAPQPRRPGFDGEARALLFSRIARNLTAPDPEATPDTSYFDAVWARCSGVSE